MQFILYVEKFEHDILIHFCDRVILFIYMLFKGRITHTWIVTLNGQEEQWVSESRRSQEGTEFN